MLAKYFAIFSGVCFGVAVSFVQPSEAVVDVAAEEGHPRWEFDTTPDGPKISFNGTVEGLYAYVQENYPDYLGTVFDLDIINAENDANDTMPSALQKRTDFSNMPYRCRRRYHTAAPANIRSGIIYLHGVKGRPRGRPYVEGRVSCSWDSAISWKNLNYTTMTLDSFGSIADGALRIWEECKYEIEVGDGDVHCLAGTTTHNDRWRVRVHFAEC